MLGESSASIYLVNARDSTKDGLRLPTLFLKRNIFKQVYAKNNVEQEMITIPKEEYDKLIMKAEIADDALTQLKLSFEDLRHGKVSKFNLKAS